MAWKWLTTEDREFKVLLMFVTYASYDQSQASISLHSGDVTHQNTLQLFVNYFAPTSAKAEVQWHQKHFYIKTAKCYVLASCRNFSSNPPGITYNVSIAERRFNPRAILDNPNKLQPQNLTLLPAVETCQHIYFHVMVRDILQTRSRTYQHSLANKHWAQNVA